MPQVRQSSVEGAGRGVFAKEPLAEGTVLGLYSGRLLTPMEWEAKKQVTCDIYATACAIYATTLCDNLRRHHATYMRRRVTYMRQHAAYMRQLVTYMRRRVTYM